ncbi:trehalose-6-phosphate synthase [Erwinia tracheiphila]|uniref:OtsA n=1 Tax=Erwinia tracheiphila TaxID=65700 RepID=A0A0M2KDC8_9GAMM|nr:trehalose-6-phosphate synthase [Erwinia tracheiphila]EOS95672.1 alpha,alpha-trehalose-phosphate synthase [Erwinia tracheiphila PSU-1]KKF37385.1 OtsA [Erwinia tracheiphila]UIA88779.1 trehalose-6-phosphate synthase [Erwinia tracheiphila]UIA97159.1 trehalose-6-phosphate synthase [Erwinia tracheiphila]
MSGLILVSHNMSHSSTLSALYKSILTCRRDLSLWISWNGKTTEFPAEHPGEFTFCNGADYDVLTFPLSDAELHDGYMGYVHKGLWPVFHQRPDLARFSLDGLMQYRKFNEVYAQAIAEYAMLDDAIWIQDYHLIPCAQLIRDAGLTNRTGFFFHQPFPAGQGFEAIPDWRWLAESLLCCDIIGFQTLQDMKNFLLWVESEFRIEHLASTRFRINGRIVTVGIFPVGIDLNDVESLIQSSRCSLTEQECRQTLPGNSVLSGGHLDDSAGLPYRISAMEILLRRHEEYVGNVVLLQLASPSAGYSHRASEMSHELETLCGELNGVKGTLDWYPINFLTHHYTREEQAGIYRASRVAVVTPLIAGMSLMAKMYVALQDPADPGVLILSQFAGASEHMDGAIIVNPYDPDAIADAIHTALHLSLNERKKMHSRLMVGIAQHDCHWWAEQFLAGLSNIENDVATPPGWALALSSCLSHRIRY